MSEKEMWRKTFAVLDIVKELMEGIFGESSKTPPGIKTPDPSENPFLRRDNE